MDFSNVVLIMTSNLRGEPGSFFRPEFVNRIDDIVRFGTLKRDDLTEIVGLQLEALKSRLAERRIRLDVPDEIKQHLAHAGYSPEYGARPLKRLIQRKIGDPLAIAMLEGRIQEGQTARAELADSGPDPVLLIVPAAGP